MSICLPVKCGFNPGRHVLRTAREKGLGAEKTPSLGFLGQCRELFVEDRVGQLPGNRPSKLGLTCRVVYVPVSFLENLENLLVEAFLDVGLVNFLLLLSSRMTGCLSHRSSGKTGTALRAGFCYQIRT